MRWWIWIVLVACGAPRPVVPAAQVAPPPAALRAIARAPLPDDQTLMVTGGHHGELGIERFRSTRDGIITWRSPQIIELSTGAIRDGALPDPCEHGANGSRSAPRPIA